MVFSKTSEKSYWLVLGLNTVLTLVGFLVAVWSIGSLKYQIEYSKERFSQVNSTVQKQNRNFKEALLQLRSKVKELQG